MHTEYLDVVDENGIPTGQVVDRVRAHREGLRHHTAHVWIARHHHGKVQILLQKRCMNKDSFPGCYDISSAGHIPAGEDYVTSALRELKEELGIDAKPEELLDCGLHHMNVEDRFHGEPFIDRQISRVFLLWRDMDESEFTVQQEEIESVLWLDFTAAVDMVRHDAIPNCIDPSELEMLRVHLV